MRMPSSSLPVAFSIRQNLPSSASSIKYHGAPCQNSLLPSAAVPHPSSVRHRLRAVLPETLKDAQMESESSTLYDNDALNAVNELNNTTQHATRTWHQPQPAIQQLVEGLPAESVLLLNAVAFIWGSQHPVIKMVVNDCDTSAFSLVRFCFAALIASIFSPPWNMDEGSSGSTSGVEEPSKAMLTWRWGAEMGLWMFLGYAFQAIGLEVSSMRDDDSAALPVSLHASLPLTLSTTTHLFNISDSTLQRNDQVSCCT